VPGDECLELADDVAVPPQLEIGLDPLLDRDEPELLEPCSRGNERLSLP